MFSLPLEIRGTGDCRWFTIVDTIGFSEIEPTGLLSAVTVDKRLMLGCGSMWVVWSFSFSSTSWALLIVIDVDIEVDDDDGKENDSVSSDSSSCMAVIVPVIGVVVDSDAVITAVFCSCCENSSTCSTEGKIPVRISTLEQRLTLE